MIQLWERSLVQLVWAALVLVAVSISPASASELSPQLRQLVIEAGMVPWSWRPVPLDETLRDLNGEKVQLRQFVTGDKPLLVYMYGHW